MRRILHITDHPFWLLGAGALMRTTALLWYLARRFHVSVVFLADKPLDPRVAELLRAQAHNVEMLAPHLSPSAPTESAFRYLTQLTTERRFNAVIFDHLHLAPLRPAIQSGPMVLVDTHDFLSDRTASMRAHQLASEHEVSFAEELAVLRQFDAALLIQQDDHARVTMALGAERAILAPHPVNFARQDLRPEVRHIGFVASGWRANVDALSWFVAEVWPQVRGAGRVLDVYGRIRSVWHNAHPDIVMHGYVPSYGEVYGALDIVVNPLRWGSGLKIKTVEALGFGLPLVSTPEGVRGLARDTPPAFVEARDATQFAAALHDLIADLTLRQTLGKNAHAYAQRHFSADACFGPLVKILEHARARG